MSFLKKLIVRQGFPAKLTEEGQEILEGMRVVGYRCTHLVVVDMTNIGNPQQWITTHQKYFPDTAPSPDPNCTHDRQYIDVIKFLDVEKDYDKTKLAKWLKFYGHNICFKETYEYIECSHLIHDEVAEELLRLVEVNDTVKFSDINAELVKLGYNYKTDNYQHYIRMEFDAGKIKIDILDDYDPNGHCYSVPMLRRLLEKYGKDTDADQIIDDIDFDFRVADIYGDDKTYVSVKVGASEKFYDFSQIPNVARPTVLYVSFSPL